MRTTTTTRPTWSNGSQKTLLTLSDYRRIEIDRATAILADLMYRKDVGNEGFLMLLAATYHLNEQRPND